MGVENGLVNKSASYFSYNGDRVQGKEKFRDYLRAHPEKALEIDNALRKKYIENLNVDIPKEEVIEEMPEDYDEPDYVDTEESAGNSKTANEATE